MRANVTRAAEGFDRRSFTVAEILRMQDAGIIAEDENFELIEGEIVPMQAKSHVHERIKIALNIAIARALPEPSVDGGRSRRSISVQIHSWSPTSRSIRMVSSSRT